MSEHKKKACVIGYPVSHSRSPQLHGFWIKHYKLDACYKSELVRPDQLPGFFARLRQQHTKQGGYCGGNVTLPHKAAMVELVDVLDPVARDLGAVNTFWFEGSTLHGGNTDVYGFLANLDENAPGWDGPHKQKAVVLGAGGAARAVLYGLIKRGFSLIYLANRTTERAESLALLLEKTASEQNTSIITVPWAKAEEGLAEADLLINTTSLGMAHQPPLVFSLQNLLPSALVSDIVYTPLKTGLLKAAESHGNPTVDGLGMLLHQAAPGFEKWFGVRPEVTASLRAAMLGEA